MKPGYMDMTQKQSIIFSTEERATREIQCQDHVNWVLQQWMSWFMISLFPEEENITAMLCTDIALRIGASAIRFCKMTMLLLTNFHHKHIFGETNSIAPTYTPLTLLSVTSCSYSLRKQWKVTDWMKLKRFKQTHWDNWGLLQKVPTCGALINVRNAGISV